MALMILVDGGARRETMAADCALALLVPLLVCGQGPDEKKLDEIVPRALKTFEAPGLAIVIVKGDQVVYRKGAGVRELGSPEAITEDTVFQIASCT